MEIYPCLDGIDCVNGLAALASINDSDDDPDVVLVENSSSCAKFKAEEGMTFERQIVPLRGHLHDGMMFGKIQEALEE
mgnify:CR=1 FL=1